MSYFNPNASKAKNSNYNNYRILYGFFDLTDKQEDLCIQNTLDTININELELANWALFFRSYRGKGIISLTYHEDGSFSYPPKFITGKDLLGFPICLTEDIMNLDLKNKYIFAVIDEELDVLHALRVTLPEQLVPYTNNGAVIEFNDDYTIEDDNNEIFDSTNKLFIDSGKQNLQGDFNGALSLLNKLIKKNPNYSRAYSARGSIYKNFQEHTYALANYFDAIDVNPNNWRAYFNAGLLYFSIKEYGIGIRYIQKCLDINPFYEKALKIYSIYNNSRRKFNKTKLKINEVNAKA